MSGGPGRASFPGCLDPVADGSKSAISVHGLSVGYDGEVVVEGMELELPAGRSLALVGTNGSGKSTFLKTIAGLLPPMAGSIEVLGSRPLAQPARVAYMGQFHPASSVLPLRAIDIVRMARFAGHGLLGRLGARDEAAVREAMELLGVASLAREPLNELSGGQRQRVFIAQAFARGADLILLDEPATGLDAAARETYRDLARAAAASGRSVVVATHDIEEASGCDLTLLLARRVVAFGPSGSVLTPETLLSTFGVVGRYREGGVVVVEREHGHDCGDEEEQVERRQPGGGHRRH